jgi:HAD superfamily phosphatase (TIGR01668 family)
MEPGSARGFFPDGYADRLEAVSLEDLRAAGIRGIIVDLDNTAVAYRDSLALPPVAAWVQAALARDFRVVLVSNNWSDRVGAIGAQLGVRTVASAMKPWPGAFLRALRVLGTRRDQTVVVGDQLLTDVLGAKLMGMRAILTEPISEHGFVTTRLLRGVERVLLRLARARAAGDGRR